MTWQVGGFETYTPLAKEVVFFSKSLKPLQIKGTLGVQTTKQTLLFSIETWKAPEKQA